MTIDINNLLCVKCGKRGFKRITKQYNTIEIPALECLNSNCAAQVYEHDTMIKIEEEKGK